LAVFVVTTFNFFLIFFYCLLSLVSLAKILLTFNNYFWFAYIFKSIDLFWELIFCFFLILTEGVNIFLLLYFEIYFFLTIFFFWGFSLLPTFVDFFYCLCSSILSSFFRIFFILFRELKHIIRVEGYFSSMSCCYCSL